MNLYLEAQSNKYGRGNHSTCHYVQFHGNSPLSVAFVTTKHCSRRCKRSKSEQKPGHQIEREKRINAAPEENKDHALSVFLLLSSLTRSIPQLDYIY